MNIKADGEVKQLLIGKQDANDNIWCGNDIDLTDCNELPKNNILLGKSVRPIILNGKPMKNCYNIGNNLFYFELLKNMTKGEVYDIFYDVIYKNRPDKTTNVYSSVLTSKSDNTTCAIMMTPTYLRMYKIYPSSNSYIDFAKDSTAVISENYSFFLIVPPTVFPTCASIGAGTYKRTDFYNSVNRFVTAGSSRNLVTPVTIQCGGRVWIAVSRLEVISASGGLIRITCAQANGGEVWWEEATEQNTFSGIWVGIGNKDEALVTVIDDIIFV